MHNAWLCYTRNIHASTTWPNYVRQEDSKTSRGCTCGKVWHTCQGRKLPNGAALALQSAAATARTVGIGVFDRSMAAASDGATTCMQISGRLYMVPHRLQAARHLSPLAG